jgi:hypothetical protein
MIVPCGHRCLCRNCADSVMLLNRLCPLCRTPIEGFNQLPSKAEAKIAAEKAAAENAAADSKVVILATLGMFVSRCYIGKRKAIPWIHKRCKLTCSLSLRS